VRGGSRRTAGVLAAARARVTEGPDDVRAVSALKFPERGAERVVQSGPGHLWMLAARS